MDEDRLREIIREELNTFGTGLEDYLLRLTEGLKATMGTRPAVKFREKVKTPLYTAVLEFLQEHPGVAVRPGEIAKTGVGAGPQPIGMILKRMANEGVVDVESLPPDYTGYVAKKYRLKET